MVRGHGGRWAFRGRGPFEKKAEEGILINYHCQKRTNTRRRGKNNVEKIQLTSGRKGKRQN